MHFYPLSEKEREELSLGIEQFNKQEFFACHETLEKLWQKQDGSVKELLQGLIQLAVGYYHMLNGNSKGALKLLNRGLIRVAKYRPTGLDLALSDLCEGVESTIPKIENSQDGRIDPSSIPRVRFL